MTENKEFLDLLRNPDNIRSDNPDLELGMIALALKLSDKALVSALRTILAECVFRVSDIKPETMSNEVLFEHFRQILKATEESLR